MKTLTLDEASCFLRLPTHEIITRIETGSLPAVKLGDELVFIDDDLADYLRGHYHPALEKNGIALSRYSTQSQVTKPDKLFKELVPHMLRIEESRVRRCELSAKTLRITGNRLAKWVSPYFNDMMISEINYPILEAFIESLTDADIKGVAISQYLIIIRKVLNYALLTNLISSLPQFPKVKAPRASRGAFTVNEYRSLLKTSWRMRGQSYMMQNRPKLLHINE